MSGILEQIQLQQGQIFTLLSEMSDSIDALKKGKEIPSNIVDINTSKTPPPAPKTETTQTMSAPAGAELDTNGNWWDGAVHAGTKTKSAKGVWNKVRNYDKELYKKLMAAQLASADAGVEQEFSDTGESEELRTLPDKKVPTPPASKKAPPPPPSAKADPILEAQKAGLKYINDLTENYNVNYDFILASISANVTKYVEIPSELSIGVTLELKTWNEWLAMIDDDSVKIEKMGAQAGVDGMATIYGNYNNATLPNQIIPADLPAVQKAVSEYRTAWDEVQ